MAEPIAAANFGRPRETLSTFPGSRMSVDEIARRLAIGRLAVYAMLERQIIPGIRLGRRWIITRHAYEQWERSCGIQTGGGLLTGQEVTVLKYCRHLNARLYRGRRSGDT